MKQKTKIAPKQEIPSILVEEILIVDNSILYKFILQRLPKDVKG